MKLEGLLFKVGGYWVAEVPALDLSSQGRSPRKARAMLKDAIESLVAREGFEATVAAKTNRRIEVSVSDVAPLVSLLLKRQRLSHGLSLSEVARRLKATSRNAYARYEQGKAVPSIEKLSVLLSAVAPELDLFVRAY